MNILFTCVVGHGHFHPMVPLAEAFREAGIRDRVSRLLQDDRYAREASSQRTAIEAMPAPKEVAARLEDEVARGTSP